MAAITREQGLQFRVRFAALVEGGVLGFGRKEPTQVDPFLIGRAIAGVMAECTVRSATGRPMLWNDYRVILARADFEALRPLAARVDTDLRELLGRAAAERGAELVGAMRITVVADEANELTPGEAVVRVAFVATEQLTPARVGEMTIVADRFSEPIAAAAAPAMAPAPAPVAAPAIDATIHVPDSVETTGPRFSIRWLGGSTIVASGHVLLVGRPHPDAPGRFVALHGASPRINKQQFMIATTKDGVLTIARLPNANPVEVAGRSLGPGEQIQVATPATVSLSRGELVVEISRV